MSEATDLATARANLATAIKNATANPKPNYSIDGQTVNWADYLAMLTAQYNTLGTLINSTAPFEIETQAF